MNSHFSGLQNRQKINESKKVSRRESLFTKKSNLIEYGYGWWLHNFLGKDLYYMRGHLGQFVIVIPQDNLIIVRLGHIKGIQTSFDPHSEDLYVYVEEAYKMLAKRKK